MQKSWCTHYINIEYKGPHSKLFETQSSSIGTLNKRGWDFVGGAIIGVSWMHTECKSIIHSQSSENINGETIGVKSKMMNSY